MKLRFKKLRHMPCIACGRNAHIEVHHLIGHGFSGMAMKADDSLTIPLCSPCHHSLHHSGHVTWEELQGWDQEEMLEMVNKHLTYSTVTL